MMFTCISSRNGLRIYYSAQARESRRAHAPLRAIRRALDEHTDCSRTVHLDEGRPVLPDEKADVESAAKGCFVVILIAAAVIITEERYWGLFRLKKD